LVRQFFKNLGDTLEVETFSHGKDAVVLGVGNLIYKSYHDKLKVYSEWEDLKFLYDSGIKVPKPLDREVIVYLRHAPFLCMEKIDGELLYENYKKENSQEKELTITKYVKEIIKVHNLELKTKKTSREFIEKEVKEIRKRFKNYGVDELFKGVYKWIEEYELKEIVENSYFIRDTHPWNALLNKKKDVVLIDINLEEGDYRFDIAWLYTLMERSNFRDFAIKYKKTYEDITKKKIEDFNFFKVLANLSWLSTVLREYLGKNKDFFKSLINNAILILKELTTVSIDSLE